MSLTSNAKKIKRELRTSCWNSKTLICVKLPMNDSNTGFLENLFLRNLFWRKWQGEFQEL